MFFSENSYQRFSRLDVVLQRWQSWHFMAIFVGLEVVEMFLKTRLTNVARLMITAMEKQVIANMELWKIDDYVSHISSMSRYKTLLYNFVERFDEKSFTLKQIFNFP